MGEGFCIFVGCVVQEVLEDVFGGLGVVEVLGVDAGADDGDDVAFGVVWVVFEEGLVGVEGFFALGCLVEVVGDLVLGVAVHGGVVVFVIAEVLEHGEVSCGGVLEVALGDSL